jgi:hypothetical protein
LQHRFGTATPDVSHAPRPEAGRYRERVGAGEKQSTSAEGGIRIARDRLDPDPHLPFGSTNPQGTADDHFGSGRLEMGDEVLPNLGGLNA